MRRIDSDVVYSYHDGSMTSNDTTPTDAVPRSPRVLDAVYAAGLVLGLPYIALKMLFDRRYREGLGERLGFGSLPSDGDFRVWFHGASAGEILAARALYRLMKEEKPGLQAVFSTLTYTGKTAAQRTYPDCTATYLPIDMRCAVGRALERFRPDLVVLMEGDIWPNFICEAKALGARVAVANGTFSGRSARSYGRFGFFFGPALEAIDLFCLRDEEQASNLAPLSLPKKKILVTGSVKYDNLKTETDEALRRIRETLCIVPHQTVVVGGSTHKGEEESLLNLFADRHDFRLIITPRYTHRARDLKRLAEKKNLSACLFSDAAAGKIRPSARDVIIVDTVGDLADIYQVAAIAFVGGSLIPRGGQNILEPAVLGAAVVFGKHTFHFKEDIDLLKDADAAVEVADAEELRETVSALLDDPKRRKQIGARARKLILEKRGAGRLTFDAIKQLFR